ncbi:hypothetical protein Vi05172_g11654 [Venturia inaequalis]|nr:hypothetical protein Vi05172_g11654 [Venturia inaequalis]
MDIVYHTRYPSTLVTIARAVSQSRWPPTRAEAFPRFNGLSIIFAMPSPSDQIQKCAT